MKETLGTPTYDADLAKRSPAEEFREYFKLAIPMDMLEASNMGIDFFAELTNLKCSSVRPVVPDIKGSLFSTHELIQALSPPGVEKSITADILFKSITLD